MKKNNKGFTLLETLIVTTFVVTTLIYLFIQISNITVSYDITFRYNTVPGVYNALNISNYVDSEGYKNMANGLYLETKTYYNLNDNTSIDGGISDFYDDLVSKIDAKNIIFTDENLSKLNEYLETGTLTAAEEEIFNEDFIRFISKIEYEEIPGVYRVIIEYKDKTYATVKIGDTTEDLINPVISNLAVSGVNGNFNIADNVALSGYGCNQSGTVEPTWTSTSGTTASVSCAVSTAGTYYAWAKDTSGNTSNSTFSVPESAFCSYSPGTFWNFSYSGTIQSFTVPCAGTYKLEVWGAQGGTVGSGIGGYGGYAVGNTILTKDTILYIGVGGTTTTIDGGYNAAGNGYAAGWSGSNYQQGAGGGGLTHIAKVTGILYSIGYTSAVTNGNLLIVAGGGGGGAGYGSSYANGGAGGGTTGTSGVGTYAGTGGSQTVGGLNSITGGNGGFAIGGSGSNTGSSGGGSGFYGGGGSYNSGNVSAGGGGSSYLSNSLTSASTTSGVRTGNGYATITFVSLN